MKITDLANTVVRKFVNTFLVSEWDIETDTGWQPVSSVSKTIPYDVWRIETATGKFVECADDHILFTNDNVQIFTKDCTVGTRIQTKTGLEQVTFCQRVSDAEHMYDLEVASKDHRFYANEILSHNSITTCAFILWMILFKENQNIAILANKFKTAQKLLSDLKKAYMYVPSWMQVGVVEWNKGNIELENGCKIMASSTSSDAIRGNAFNLIFLDEFAHVPSHIAEEFFNSVYPTITSGETSQVIVVSTPLGHNKFHRMWEEANFDRKSTDPTIQWNGYEPFAIHWSMVPKPSTPKEKWEKGLGLRDEDWKKQTIAHSSEEQFRQEFESFFGDVYIEVLDRSTGTIEKIQAKNLYDKFEILNKGSVVPTV